jgi:ribosome-binding protein aMBF1 (putative translation factor)
MGCSKCGKEYGKFFDVITGEGIVKLCSDCLNAEEAPIIKKPTEEQIQGENKDSSLYGRLSRIRGLDPEEHKKNVFGNEKKQEVKQEEVTLRDLVDKKFDNLGKKEKPSRKREDLIDNFHWIIMRARRNKKLTVTDLAKEINESENLIKMAEQGRLPEGDYNLVKKLESFLGINILKPEVAELLRNQRKQLGFDDFSSKNLTISDLQDMKPEDIPKPQREPYWRRMMHKIFRKENPQDELIEIDAEDEKPVQTGVQKEDLHSEDELELGTMSETPIEFADTSLEMTGIIGEEKIIEEESREEKASSDRDLTQEEIDDLIFGKKR